MTVEGMVLWWMSSYQCVRGLDPLTILDEAIQRYNPRYVVALFSGGHDSLVATHIASRHPRFSFACHINTGIGIEQTRAFVRETCQEWGVELREYKATEYINADGQPEPQCYRQMVIEYGFPGPAMHTKMYNRLKERPLRQRIRELDRDKHDKTMLVTGVRKQESERRMRHVEPVQIWEGTKIWVAPIWQLDKAAVNEYIAVHGLKRNPVVDMLHMSGECLCGAFAHSGEKEEIRVWFPEVAAELDELEGLVPFPWGWEESPPEWWTQYQNGQSFLSNDFAPLCMSCMTGVNG